MIKTSKPSIKLSSQQRKEILATFEKSFSHIRDIIGPFVPNFENTRSKYLLQSKILLDLQGTETTMLDLGCGHGFLAMIMSRMGWKVYGIDNHQSRVVNYIDDDQRKACLDADKKLWEYFGVTFIKQDLYDGIPFDDNTFDVIFCADVLEHLHNSPKPVLEDAVAKLKKGGYFMIQTPNAVNIKKRAKVLYGRTNYPPLDDWYYNGFPWVGHVREPTLSELKRMMRYCNLVVHKACAHNSFNKRKIPELIQSAANTFAKIFPSLAGYIYVIGQKV